MVEKEKVFLSKEDILNSPDLPTEEVYVKEWKTAILVRGMTSEERDKWESTTFKDGKVQFDNLRAKLVSLCVIDKEGTRLFTDTDIPKLGKKNAKAINKLFIVAQKLSGIGQEDLDELIKNSETPQPA
jgi:hypothetical protein